MKFQWVCVSLLGFALFFGEYRGSEVKFSRLDRWVKTGFQYLKLNLCRRVSLSESECKRLSHLQLSSVAVYVSESSPDQVLAILPDSYTAEVPAPKHNTYSVTPALRTGKRNQDAFPGSASHDAVLVLDPSPGESFGHSVVLFYVDFNVTKKKCGHMDGIFLGEECLTLGLKSRCVNQLKRQRSRSDRLVGRGRTRRGAGRTGKEVIPLGPETSRLSRETIPLTKEAIPLGREEELTGREAGLAGRRGRAARSQRSGGVCEIHFLPLVVGVRDGNRTQRLRCVDDPDFAPCPERLPASGPSVPLSSCELSKNTRRCHQQPLASQRSCRLYQTCDHAVLLSGGWQEQITYQRHVQNLQRFHKMLRSNGFHKEHIKTFFAGNSQVAAKDTEGMYAATEKDVIRNHIAFVCRKQHCADTLVLYLNSPTCTDGTMLLWDRNHNGIAELKERYSVGELLSDLAGCRARRVLLFLDQSYSGALAKRLRSSRKHPNVLLLSGLPWAPLQPSHCLIDHLTKSAGLPGMGEWALGLLNVTLAGAPCNATPPLSEAEMRREFMGCQNLPTALWHQGHRRGN
ncbi:uncharacterized protein si:ch211-67e16.11 isoform X2 [Engraulis encrasicolus]|uniref:uncharacterized protein si:ch211-67e16.11 isoform X2 n=1 Tax=Engraulis encrasicolus TaxID=184585 RepID=UPI002FD35693